jgi:hypothetical protein
MHWMFAVSFLACAPQMRFPGPLASLTNYGGQAPQPDAEVDEIGAVEDITLPSAPQLQRPRRPDATARRVVGGAVSLLEETRMVVDGEVYRHDCIGMVEAAYATVGIDLTSDISLLYAQAGVLGVFHQDPVPLPGDVVFFDNSYDKNGNGVRDDPNTHVAVVERVEEDGTITIVHLGGRGKPVTRRQMNLLHPDAARSTEGKVWNSHLRSVRHRDGGPNLSAQLWTGFGSFWKVTDDDLAQAARQVRSQQP